MSGRTLKARVEAAIGKSAKEPIDSYVINGQRGQNECELVLETNTEPAKVYVFERGAVDEECRFSNAEDAANYFVHVLLDAETFRERFVAGGGRFVYSATADDYGRAFKTVAEADGIDSARYSVDLEQSGTGARGSLVLAQNAAGEWAVSTVGDEEGRYAIFPKAYLALDYMYWRLSDTPGIDR